MRGRPKRGSTLLSKRVMLRILLLLDVLDLSIHPVIAGSGGLLFHEDVTATMQLVTVKTFSKIVKLTYEPQYPSAATPE